MSCSRRCLRSSEGTFQAEIELDAIESLIRWYCREAGVRNLQKHVERICRKLATKVVEQREEEEEPESRPNTLLTVM